MLENVSVLEVLLIAGVGGCIGFLLGLRTGAYLSMSKKIVEKF